MKKLIGMTAFIIYINSKEHSLRALTQIRDYANLLLLKLELWMFVPCKLVDGVWVVLEEPVYTDPSNLYYNADYVKEYQEAKERCLFEILSYEEDSENYWYFGITEFNLIGVDKSEVIESLATYELNLTDTAKKQLGWI